MHDNNLQHKLKSRHLQMIALGGVIGTGLFFGLAKAIHTTGPSIIISYIFGGLLVYIILRALGEMTVYDPSSGSFSEYANRYLGPYAGFISGWSAWFQYTIVTMVEITATAVFMDYLVPGIPHWIICLVILVIFTGINLLSVKFFGEFEFWFAGIKIVAVIAMLIFTVYLVVFQHKVNHDLSSYTSSSIFFASGLKGFISSLVIVIFSFGGSELVGIAAGEASNPKVTIPKAINGTIYKILLFYILTILAIIVLYPYQRLSGNISPFVEVFQQVGFKTAATLIDIVAITAALSGANSCLYSASRMLFNLANNGYAPKGLSKVDPLTSTPKNAVLFTSLIIIFGALINYLFPQEAIIYLLTIATGSIVLIWFLILLTQLNFRWKLASVTHLDYKVWLFPFSTIFALIILIVLVVAMLFVPSMNLSVYITPLWIILLSIIYLFIKKPSRVITPSN